MCIRREVSGKENISEWKHQRNTSINQEPRMRRMKNPDCYPCYLWLINSIYKKLASMPNSASFPTASTVIENPIPEATPCFEEFFVPRTLMKFWPALAVHSLG